MSNQIIQFGGINLSANIQDSNPGDCEELINIRSEAGSLKLNKDHKIISADIPYKRIILHDTAGKRNYIGFDNTGIVWFDPSTGAIIKRLYQSDEDLNNIHLATINNLVVISDKNDVSNTSYLFNNDSYELFINKDGLSLPITISHTEKIQSPSLDEYILSSNFDYTLGMGTTEFIKVAQPIFNKFFSENKQYVMGYYLVGINFTLWDNSETKLSQLHPFYPVDMQWGFSQQINMPIYYTKYSSSNIKMYFKFDGKIKIHSYEINATDDLKKYQEYIKSVNIYMSNPIDIINFSEDYITFDNYSSENNKYIPYNITSAGLEKQLLYKIKSYSLDEVSTGKAKGQFEFGKDIIPTNKTLGVDNGLITRSGKVQAYNNRLHYFDTRCRINLSQGYHVKCRSTSDLSYTADMYVYLRGPEGDIIVKFNDIELYSYVANEPYFSQLDAMIIIQDSRAYKIVFVRPGYYSEVYLDPSPRYNYSYAYCKDVIFTDGDQDIVASNIYSEFNAINVTAANNPIIFPVEHSYAVPSTITTLGLATEPISQTQIGQYPLYIFTDNGIYALEQGNGSVLYSNLILINTDACNKDICQTRNGVIYIANSNVYLLSGRNNLNLSLALKGPIDMDIRQCSSYQNACMNSVLYEIDKYLSQVPIEEYLKNAMLSYVTTTDDLIVSNPDFPYSYVFSFPYKTWHKTTEVFNRVGDNILQRYILTNHITDLKATGRIYVTNAVIQPAHQFNALFQAEYSNITYLTGFSEKYALIIDGVQVSAALFRYPTQLSVVIALLCKDIPYLDEYYNGDSYKIYSSMALRSGALLEIINLGTKYTVLSATFEDVADTIVTIPDKGIGDEITIIASGYNYSTRSIKKSDTVISLAEEVSYTINEVPQYGFSANISNNIIDLSAIKPGENGNNIIISCISGNYVSIYIEQLSGGKDLTLAPGDYTQLIDYSENEDCIKTFHLQSRPISWKFAYTTINRLILLCKANINPECNLSMYLFASNNLKEWHCVAASQKTNVILDHIRLQRVGVAWKYYIIMIGGKVHTTTEISSISLNINNQFGEKLR